MKTLPSSISPSPTFRIPTVTSANNLRFQGLAPHPGFNQQEAAHKALHDGSHYLALTSPTSSKRGKEAFLMKATGAHQNTLATLRSIMSGFVLHPLIESDHRQDKLPKMKQGTLVQALRNLGVEEGPLKAIEAAALALENQVIQLLVAHPKDVRGMLIPRDIRIPQTPAPGTPLEQLKQTLKLIFPTEKDDTNLLVAMAGIGISPEERASVIEVSQNLETAVVQAILNPEDPKPETLSPSLDTEATPEALPLPSLLNATLYAQPALSVDSDFASSLGLYIPDAPSGTSSISVLDALIQLTESKNKQRGTLSSLVVNAFTFSAQVIRYGEIVKLLKTKHNMEGEEIQRHLTRLAKAQLIMNYSHPDGPFEAQSRWEVLPDSVDIPKERDIWSKPTHKNAFLSMLGLFQINLENDLLKLEDRLDELSILDAQNHLNVRKIEQERALANRTKASRSVKRQRHKLNTSVDKHAAAFATLQKASSDTRASLEKQYESLATQLDQIKTLQIVTQVKADCQGLMQEMDATERKVDNQAPWKSALDKLFHELVPPEVSLSKSTQKSDKRPSPHNLLPPRPPSPSDPSAC